MAPKQQKVPEPEPEEEEEEDIDLGDEDYEDGDEMGFDLGAVLEPFLATEDGQTICTALETISKHMEKGHMRPSMPANLGRLVCPANNPTMTTVASSIRRPMPN